MPKFAIRLLAVLALLAGLPAGMAGAVELNVACAGAMASALQELAPAFEKSSGHKLKIEYAIAGKIEEKVAADEAIDVAILTKARADKLAGKAKLVGGTLATLARVSIGMAVKKGASKPDISSVDALKKSLLSAKSITYTDPVAGNDASAHIVQVLEKLGIAAELKPKIKVVPATPGQVSALAEAVKRGDSEIGLGPVGILMGVDGVDVVGPLPADLQSPNLVFLAASPMVSEQPVAAKALIDFLAGPAGKAVYKAKGMEPG